MENILKNITLFLFTFWLLYWLYAWVRTEKEKPQEKKQYALLSYQMVSSVVLKSMLVIVFLQLAGWVLYPFPEASLWQALGLGLVVLGLLTSVLARWELGSNWSPSYDYQVKKKQELVTSGIYRYIRHPIYTGILLVLIGSELVVSSYLVFAALLLIWGAYVQGKREETLLESHFGKAYVEYKKKTKMFVPFVW